MAKLIESYTFEPRDVGTEEETNRTTKLLSDIFLRDPENTMVVSIFEWKELPPYGEGSSDA